MSNSKGNGPYQSEVRHRRWLSENTFELILKRPSGFDFKPGQRLRIYQGDIARDYSMSSAPSDRDLVLCIRYIATGALSPVLKTIPLESRLPFSGPHGYFIHRPSPRPVVLVATGTGVAPFASMVRSDIGPYTLLHGARDPSELYYAELFRAGNGHYAPCLTRADASCQDHFAGRVTDYLRHRLPVREYDFYLCGHQAMITDATTIIDSRFEGSFVYTEAFY